MQLQSILLPREEICTESSLYFHKDRRTVCFDGYFNLFYIDKRKRFTNLQNLSLHIVCRGYSRIRLMHDRNEIASAPLKADEKQEYRFSFPYKETAGGVFWFSLEEDPDTENRSITGFFEGDADHFNPVHLAVDICTFKREPYITKNLRAIDRFIHNAPEGICVAEAADHIRVYVVDNGRTLSDEKAVTDLISKNPGRIKLIPNRNIGGAGGFTRGMLEALDEQKAFGLTHILLMDDDAVFDPDVFVRVYGFLSTVRKEYRDITLGGTLLREDYPSIMEAGGEWYQNFRGWNDHPLYDLSTYENCTADFMTSTEFPHKTMYSGWWCCCYSLAHGKTGGSVRCDNLPLPLFLHHDDIIFGLQNESKGLVFLNGVSVWHKGAGLTFAKANEYYDIRNPLISESLFHENTGSIPVIKKVWSALTAMLIEYRYAEAVLAYRGLIDFLKGPDWLYRVNPEKLNNTLRAYIQKHFPMKPWEELGEEYTAEKQEIEKAIRNFSYDTVERNAFSGKLTPEKLLHIVTFNGWFLPSDEKSLAVSSTDSLFRGFRKRKLILFEPTTGQAAVAVRDEKMIPLFFSVYVRSAFLILTKYQKTARLYRRRASKISSAEAWKRKLDM